MKLNENTKNITSIIVDSYYGDCKSKEKTMIVIDAFFFKSGHSRMLL